MTLKYYLPIVMLIGCGAGESRGRPNAPAPAAPSNSLSPNSRPTGAAATPGQAVTPALSTKILASATTATGTAEQQAAARQGCRLLAPGGGVEGIEWTAEERSKPIAIRPLGSTPTLSYHCVRAAGAEQPHVHDKSDLSVFVISGHVIAHIGESAVFAGPGSIISIPRGTPHWVENTGSTPSESVAIFSPPFDGKDRRFITEATASK